MSDSYFKSIYLDNIRPYKFVAEDALGRYLLKIPESLAGLLSHSIESFDNFINTAFDLGVRHKKYQSADINYDYLYPTSPLVMAIEEQDIRSLRAFIKFGFDLDGKDSNSMDTPLGRAISMNFVDAIKELIHCGADVAMKSSYGQDELVDIALDYRNYKTTKTLILAGANFDLYNVSMITTLRGANELFDPSNLRLAIEEDLKKTQFVDELEFSLKPDFCYQYDSIFDYNSLEFGESSGECIAWEIFNPLSHVVT